MSLAQDVTNLKAKLEEIKAEHLTLHAEQTELKKAHEQLQGEHDHLIKDHGLAIEQMSEQHATALRQVAGELATSKEANEKMTTDLSVVKGELASAHRGLADPHFAHAAARGEDEPTKQSALEAPDPDEDGTQGTANPWTVYQSLTEPAARTAYWNENEAAIRAAQRVEFAASKKKEE